MKTFYILWLLICGIAVLCVSISQLPCLGKIILCFLMLFMAWREVSKFQIKSISIQNDKILIKEGSGIFASGYQKTSVVTRHLCFLHLRALDSARSWYLPVSRLEFSQESFRQLKVKLQRFSMQ